MVKLNLIFCLIIIIVSPVLSRKKPSRSNKLLLVSFDGLQADKFNKYVKENLESNFRKFLKSGIYSPFMIPSFPSLTFPSI